LAEQRERLWSIADVDDRLRCDNADACLGPQHTVADGEDARLHGAAAHSVLAQMIELVRSGKVKCDGSPGLDSDYRLAG